MRRLAYPTPLPSGSSVTRKWVYKAVNWIKNEPAIGPDGTVYIGDAKFPLCALSGASGARLWCTDVGGYVAQSSPAIGNPFVKTDAAGTRHEESASLYTKG